MARKALVVLMIVVALGLILWAGLSNFRARNAQRAATAPQHLALTPDSATPDSATPDSATPDSATPDSATPASPADSSGSEASGMPPNPLLGKTAPNFTLEDSTGRKASLASFKGRPVLVNFWATWCGPCKYEIPWLTTLRTQYAPQGFEILGVSADELGSDGPAEQNKVKATVLKAAKSLKINYPVLFGGDTIEKAYGGIDLLPQSFYVDKTGKVVAVITGAGSKAEAEADIQKAIHSGL